MKIKELKAISSYFLSTLPKKSIVKTLRYLVKKTKSFFKKSLGFLKIQNGFLTRSQCYAKFSYYFLLRKRSA